MKIMSWKKFSLLKKFSITLIVMIIIPVIYIFMARMFVEERDCSREYNDFNSLFKEVETDTTSSNQPNVVFILSDDQAWNHYSFLRHPHIKTPNIDKLASESLTFTRGYVSAPLCSPSLASIITGLHPHKNGITGNDPKVEDGGFRADLVEMRLSDSYLQAREKAFSKYLKRFYAHPNIIRTLDSLGYVSFQSGKWWLGSAKDGGFDEGMTTGSWECYGRHGDEGLKIGREGMKPVFDFLDAASQSENSFFLWYAPFMPHWPHTPPEKLLEKYMKIAPSKEQAKYWAMCEWFDETVGQLLDHLEKRNLSENTIIVYVADNGWIQDTGWSLKSLTPAASYAPKSKRSPYEGGVRTPIIIKWPKRIKPYLNKQTFVSAVDIVPTILDLVGLEKPMDMEGISLVDSLQLHQRDYIFSADYAHDMGDFNDATTSLESRTVFQNPWKLIVPHEPNSPEGQIELFNVVTDEKEEENVASGNPEVVDRLKRALEEWWEVETQ